MVGFVDAREELAKDHWETQCNNPEPQEGNDYPDLTELPSEYHSENKFGQGYEADHARVVTIIAILDNIR